MIFLATPARCESSALVWFGKSLVVNPLKFVPKTWLTRGDSRLPPLPAPPCMVSTPCPRPAPSPASRTVSTSQRRSRPGPPHLNARQHIPDPSTHPDRGPAYLSRACCRPISSRSLKPDTRRPSATTWQPTTKKGNELTPYFLSWSPPSELCRRSRFGGDNLGNQNQSRCENDVEKRWKRGEHPHHRPSGQVCPRGRAPRTRPVAPQALLPPSFPCAFALKTPVCGAFTTRGGRTLRRVEGRGRPELMGASIGRPRTHRGLRGEQPRHGGSII